MQNNHSLRTLYTLLSHTHTHTQSVRLLVVKATLADNTAQGSVLVLIKFSSNNPKAQSRKSTGRQEVKNATVKQSPRQKYPKHRIQQGQVKNQAKGQNHRQTEYSMSKHTIKCGKTPGQPEVQSVRRYWKLFNTVSIVNISLSPTHTHTLQAPTAPLYTG